MSHFLANHLVDALAGGLAMALVCGAIMFLIWLGGLLQKLERWLWPDFGKVPEQEKEK